VYLVLDEGPHTVTVYPEITTVDSYGDPTERRRASGFQGFHAPDGVTTSGPVL
jgi:hypothetical protein